MSGLPNSIDDSCLEITCIDILGKVGVNVIEHDIEACHGLPTRKVNRDKPVILKIREQQIYRKKLLKMPVTVIIWTYLMSMDVTVIRKYF